MLFWKEKIRFVFLKAALLCTVLTLHGQGTEVNFLAPLDIPLFLTGNFAEMRRNHFHTGIDIKTQGREGLPVKSIAEGKVSRINVSPYGYGLALYIDHPSGHTSVYGHLSAYNAAIEEVVRAEQYREQSFAVDFKPEMDMHVKAGELIALSGNTGGSGGPHLHFEIRETDSEHPLNPLLFGFDIKDDIAPHIRGLRFHPLSDTTLINGENRSQSFVVFGANGAYKMKDATPIRIYGPFGISVHAIDYLNEYPNKCGVYSLELYVDKTLICAQSFEKLDFATVRNINSYQDYAAFKNQRWHYHKSFVEPGNKLEIYDPKPLNNGRLHYRTDGLHEGNYLILDAYGNKAALTFEFQTLDRPVGPLPVPENYEAYFDVSSDNRFTYPEELDVFLPEGALYTPVKFLFGREEADDNSQTPYYTLQNEDVPLQLPIQLRFDLSNIAPAVWPKLLLRRNDISGGTSYYTGHVADGNFIADSKEFGRFSLVLDSSAPSLRPIQASGSVRRGSELRYKISDGLSGILKYNALVNGEWALMRYEPKNASIYLLIDETIFAKGKNTVLITVEDGCGNKVEGKYIYSF